MSLEFLLSEKRSKKTAMWRGAQGRCPACNAKTLFRKYLKVHADCPSCNLHLGSHRADDAPPYFTIFIVGHIVVPMALLVEKLYIPPLYMHALIFTILSLVLSLAFLPIVKGAVVGLQWALRLHGFGENEEEHKNRNGGDKKYNETN